MANQWFRMYAEFAHDPKVQMMSEAMQRRYMMLMCMRCSNELVTLHDDEVAFHLRITNDEWIETKRHFVAKGFIDDALNLLNWEKRQFKSDSSADRVAKHRAKIKASKASDVTLQVTQANALDTDTDTDTDTDNPLTPATGDCEVVAKAEPLFDQFWKAYPKRVGKDAARKKFEQRKFKRCDMPKLLSAIAMQSQSEQWRKDNGQYIPNPATWLNQGRFDDEVGDAGVTQPSSLGVFV